MKRSPNSHAKAESHVSRWPTTKASQPRHYRVELECGHSNAFPSPVPESGRAVWCPSCDDYRPVTKPLPQSNGV
jgi:hypothetical protein